MKIKNLVFLVVALSFGSTAIAEDASQTMNNLAEELKQLEAQIKAEREAPPGTISPENAVTPQVTPISTTPITAPTAATAAPLPTPNSPDFMMSAQAGAPTGADAAAAETLNPELSDAAYEEAVSELLPLTPAQIRQLRMLMAETQRASAAPPGIPLKPVLTSQTVNLSPGDTPPVVRPSTGYVTSLVFLDVTGEAWPIAYINIGNPKAYNVNWDGKGNVVLLQSITPFISANLAVGLKGLNTPIMVKLLPEQQVVDYRVDFRVPFRTERRIAFRVLA